MTIVALVGVNRWGYRSLAGPLLKNWARRDADLNGVGIELFDLSFEESADEIAERILGSRPALVGFSCFLWNIQKILQIALRLKERAPGIKIALGGPELAATAEKTIEGRPEVDFVSYAEGEETFRLLLRCLLLDDRPLSAVPGLVYRDGGAAVKTAEAPLIDMDQPAFVYAGGGVKPDETCALLETSRGCPFLCSFCDWGPRKMRYVPLAKLAEEFNALAAQSKYVFLCDADILMDKPRGLAILEMFAAAAEGKECTLHFESDPTFLVKEAVDIIARDPFKFQMGFGLQSVNAQTLKNISRNLNLSKVAENLAYLKLKAPQAQFGLSIIYGLPGEDLEGFKRTMDWTLRWRPGCFCANQLLMIPGADMSRDAERFGLKAQAAPPYQVLETAAMGPPDIRRARELAYYAGVLLAFRPCIEILDSLLDSHADEAGYRLRLVEAWARFMKSRNLDLSFGMPILDIDEHRVDERIIMAAARLREDKMMIAAVLAATRHFAAMFSEAGVAP